MPYKRFEVVLLALIRGPDPVSRVKEKHNDTELPYLSVHPEKRRIQRSGQRNITGKMAEKHRQNPKALDRERVIG